MNIINKSILITALIFLNAACHANKHTPVKETQKTREMTAEWEKGNRIAKEGSRQLHSGEKMIKRGESNVAQGQKKIADGNKIMRKCDFAFQEYAEEEKYHELDDC